MIRKVLYGVAWGLLFVGIGAAAFSGFLFAAPVGWLVVGVGALYLAWEIKGVADKL